MAGRKQDPSYRDLDIYRLVVARMWKRKHAADSFGLSHSRLAQIIRRVREWVDQRVGDWLFPGCPDLRFYAALDKADIRVREGENPDLVIIEHATGRHRYARAPVPTAGARKIVHAETPQAEDQPDCGEADFDNENLPAPDPAKQTTNVSPIPLNFFSDAKSSPRAATHAATPISTPTWLPQPAGLPGQLLAQ
jgi:hypothetical protein